MKSNRRSDRYWEERRAQRNRRLWIGGTVVISILAVIVGLRTAFYDTCTRSREIRDPEAVVSHFLDAVRQRDRSTAALCWRNQPYTELLTDGCGERCLNGFFGTQFEVSETIFAEPQVVDGRLALTATIDVVCSAETETPGATHQGTMTLDTTPREFPWRHWKIVHSTVGGDAVHNWCEE